MEFFVGGLEELIQDPKITLQQAVVRAYPSTLKPFHGWLLVQVWQWVNRYGWSASGSAGCVAPSHVGSPPHWAQLRTHAGVLAGR